MTSVSQQLGICVKCGEKYEPSFWPGGAHHCGRKLWIVATIGDDKYRLDFPVSELGNAIALLGWTWVNEIRRKYTFDREVNAELRRLEALPHLDIPDGRDWFATHATKIA